MEAAFDPTQPHIELTVERVACARHGEPFRAAWRKGWPAFMLNVLHALLADEEFIDACRTADGDGEKADVEQINVRLDEKPACERVSRAVLLSAYRECGVGVRARCVVCRQKKDGTPYQTSAPAGVQTHKHVCFECVLDNLRPML